jgi:CubicO group peptidase (beta-lactamase class C family)
VAPGCVAGLAVAAGGREAPAASWFPEDLADEPSFLVYSITKTVTAVLILRLCEGGQLRLNKNRSRAGRRRSLNRRRSRSVTC